MNRLAVLSRTEPARLPAGESGAERRLVSAGAQMDTVAEGETLGQGAAPTAPVSQLPSVPPDRFSAADARSRADSLRVYLTTMPQRLQSAAIPDTNADAEHLRSIVIGLRLHTPSLDLRVYEIPDPDERPHAIRDGLLCRHVAMAIKSGLHWQAVVVTESHQMALSLSCSERRNCVSLILLDSAYKRQGLDKFAALKWTNVIEQIGTGLNRLGAAEEEPTRLALTVCGSSAQLTIEGCTIFALAAARKMATDPEFGDLRRSRLEALENDVLAPGLHHLDAMYLPPAFMKHATSKRVIREYLDARRRLAPSGLPPRADVEQVASASKRPRLETSPSPTQMLTERFENFKVKRGLAAFPGSAARPIEYSNSYEHKRIALIRKAIEGLEKTANATSELCHETPRRPEASHQRDERAP